MLCYNYSLLLRGASLFIGAGGTLILPKASVVCPIEPPVFFTICAHTVHQLRSPMTPGHLIFSSNGCIEGPTNQQSNMLTSSGRRWLIFVPKGFGLCCLFTRWHTSPVFVCLRSELSPNVAAVPD